MNPKLERGPSRRHDFSKLARWGVPIGIFPIAAAVHLAGCTAERSSQLVETTRHALLSTFAPAPSGCAMAHCDTRMSDAANAQPPRSRWTKLKWHDTAPPGTLFGIGCSSNGTRIACTYTGARDNLVVYDTSGARLWTSKELLGSTAWMSAPIIASDGSVIAAAEGVVARFGPDGDVVWAKTGADVPPGQPISPVVTDSGFVVLATKGGPISVFHSSDGHPIGALWLRTDPSDPEYFETINTPSVDGDRIYVSTQRTNDPQHTAWLAAVDISETSATPVKEAWHFEFGGPSGGSPLRIGSTIYFDGDRVHPGDPEDPHVFAVRDDGTSGTPVFAVPVASSIQASPAQDPRGGFWVFPVGTPTLLHLDETDGHEIERLDVDELVGAPGVHLPSSVMTMAGTPDAPVMLVGAMPKAASLGATYATAIDLGARSLLWKVKIANARAIDFTSGQFAIAQDPAGKPLVVFAGFSSGAYALGE